MTDKNKTPAPRRPQRWLKASLGAVAMGVMLASGAAHAGFTNGGFEDGDLTGWTAKKWSRTVGGSGELTVAVPTGFDDLKLQNGIDALLGSGNSVAAYKSNLPFIRTGAENSLVDDTKCAEGGYSNTTCNGDNSAPNLTLPRWGSNVLRIGGHGSRVASSVEQTAKMTVADIDPIDGKIHVRFAIAPIMYDEGHSGSEQPYFFVEVHNKTKGTQLFSTFNFVGQKGVPWQQAKISTNPDVYSGYKYTDWQGFDISPGNGLLDVGDEVTLSVYVANCSQGGAGHTSLVYLDAVGAFMPGLAVQATGPSSTQPGSEITYTYNYTNNSGVYALGSEVQITAPFTEDGKALTFVEADIPANCSKPAVDHDPDTRGKYITCDVGDLANNQGGSLGVKFTVPGDAVKTAPYNVINNGDYNIYANSVSPYLGPLVKTNMPLLGSGGSLVDLGVTIDNGGQTSYATGATPTYTVTVTNHSGTETSGTVTQVLTGMGNNCGALTFNPGLGSRVGYTCDTEGSGVKITFPTGNLPANVWTQYTVTGPVSGAVVNTSAKVEVGTPNVDSNLSNNTAGLNTPVGTQHNLTVNADGNGAGNVLSTEPALKCGTSAVACNIAGETKPVTEEQEVRFTPVPHPGSMFTGWTGCIAPGAEPQGNICVVKGLTGDKTVTANFVQAVLVTPKIDATDPANPGGSIDKGPTQVEKGTTTPPAFIITPDTGKFPNVIGSSNTCEGTLAGPANDGTYTYTPKAPVAVNCEFTVRFGSDKVNATDDSIKVPADGTPTGTNVTANDTLLGGGELNKQVTVTKDPEFGTVSCTNTGVCTYSPNPQNGTDPFPGDDSFEYKVCLLDPSDVCDTATVNVTGTPEMEPKLELPPGTVGQPYNKGKLTCTNVGTAGATNVTCTAQNLPDGLTVGQCTLNGADWTQSAAVGIGQVVECPITGTPTTAGSPDPSNPPTGVTTEDNCYANYNCPSVPAEGNNNPGSGNNAGVITPAPAAVPVDNPFALILLALGLLGLGARYARKRSAA